MHPLVRWCFEAALGATIAPSRSSKSSERICTRQIFGSRFNHGTDRRHGRDVQFRVFGVLRGLHWSARVSVVEKILKRRDAESTLTIVYPIA